MSGKHTKLLIRDAFLSTLFVFACIAIFAFNPFNFHIFDSLTASFKDMEITDIIFSAKNPKNPEIEAKISNDIILINAADRHRGELAILLNKINSQKPAVIGVDFVFEGPKSVHEDSLLKSVFEKIPKLVLASKFKNEGNNSYITASATLGKPRHGYANFRITDMMQTVRYFRAQDEYKNKPIYPFALEVVKQFDSSKAKAFMDRKRTFELINYDGNLNALHHFSGNDIESDNFPEGFLKNKIVLVGFFGSDCNANPVLDDYFYTPLNEKVISRKLPDAYGVIIQANIINMILKQKYITKTPPWIEWFLSFIICIIHNFIFIRHFVHKHLWYHFYAKLIQLITTIILIFICIYFFRNFDIKLSASPFIIPVLLTVDLLYFYDTLVKWMHKKYNIKTYLLSGPLHH